MIGLPVCALVGIIGLCIFFFISQRNRLSPSPTQQFVLADPLVCALPALPGNCKALSYQYFYDTSAQECRQFKYSGCGGNANRFPTIEACESACKK